MFREYQSCFHKTKKQTLERPGEKPFEVSEMYIFGKFEGFCKRLEKVCTSLMQPTFSIKKQKACCYTFEINFFLVFRSLG